MSLQDTHVSLAHGNGGRYMRELIKEIFARHLANPLLDTDTDAAILPWNAGDGELVFTTDSFTVQPIEFPGGNIGSLSVHGTTNDLAVAGAIPKYLSLGVLLEEGVVVLLAQPPGSRIGEDEVEPEIALRRLAPPRAQESQRALTRDRRPPCDLPPAAP